MTIFKFEIEAWDAFDEKKEIDRGIVAGETYGDAANKLVNIYTTPNGDNEIFSMKLCEIENTNGIIFDYDLKKEIE